MKSSLSEPMTKWGHALRRVLSSRRGALVPCLAVILSVTCLSGCSPFRGLQENLAYNDSVNDFVMGWRNSVWARQAWNERKWMHVDEPQFISFGQGFRDGYADVAGGGSGCVPGLPPRSFWTWKYQTGEGQAKVAAYFAGYPYGARAAHEDGANHFQQIQVSHLIEAQYSPEFQAGKCPDLGHKMEPHGPSYELLPENDDPAPLPAPARESPTPMSPTTQAVPVPVWSFGQDPAPQGFMNSRGAVVPAGYVAEPSRIE